MLKQEFGEHTYMQEKPYPDLYDVAYRTEAAAHLLFALADSIEEEVGSICSLYGVKEYAAGLRKSINALKLIAGDVAELSIECDAAENRPEQGR